MSEETIRLNKAIARAGLASRREADRLIAAGQVRLNGQVVTELGTTLDPAKDRLEVEGRTVPLQVASTREVWALYKPKNCVSTLSDPEGRPTVADYFPRTASRLFPVGRLDYDAEGLILLTNDGELAQQVAHPSYGVEKVYLVKVKGLVGPESLKALAQGPVLDGRKRQGVKARVLHNRNDKTWLEVTLKEGVQHHIKKVFADVGHRVLKIKRYRIGAVELGEMQPGETRKLGRAETAWMLERQKAPLSSRGRTGKKPPPERADSR